MSKRGMRLGELLVHLGRVSPEDVTRALAYQQEHGGYMGDALIRLGALSREELRWTLADQYDIPFVRLKPENIDRGLVAMVPAAWAREHHMLPVLRDGDQVTVVIGDVTDLEKLDEVRRMTGAASVQPALSSPEAIQELVDAVYAPAVEPPGRLGELLADALQHGAVAFGVSVRRGSAVGWYRVVETVHRPLLPDWESELSGFLSPLPPLTVADSPAYRAWRGLLEIGGAQWAVACSALGQGCALEWAARVQSGVPAAYTEATLSAGAAGALRDRLARGPTLVGVAAPAEAALRDTVGRLVAGLPALLLGPGTRAIHLCDFPVAAGGETLSLPVGEPIAGHLETLEAFSPQALTVDVERFGDEEAEAARRVSPLTVVRVRGAGEAAVPCDLQLRLRLDADGSSWSLSGADDAQD